MHLNNRACITSVEFEQLVNNTMIIKELTKSVMKIFSGIIKMKYMNASIKLSCNFHIK